MSAFKSDTCAACYTVYLLIVNVTVNVHRETEPSLLKFHIMFIITLIRMAFYQNQTNNNTLILKAKPFTSKLSTSKIFQ